MTYYYAQTLKNLITTLLDVFNDIHIHRVDSNGALVTDVHVPIMFIPDKYYLIRKEAYSQEGGTKYYQQLPRLGLIYNGLSYSSDRATACNQIRNWYNDALSLNETSAFYTDFQPVPYDFQFTLGIRTDAFDDYCQIIENILPYFNPTLSLRVNEFSFLSLERDLIVKLDNTTVNFETSDQTEPTKRYVNGEMSFTVLGFIYGPVTNDSSIIKIIDSKYYINNVDTIITTSGSVLADEYITSGIQGTSAGDIDVSAIPSSYNFSGYSTDDNFYWFSSATSYDI